MPISHPEIIAHRGASRERPENTLAAFERALELGADAIELDIHATADSVLIVHHDPVVSKSDSSPPVPIVTLSASEVEQYTFRGEPIPTLPQVLDAVGDRCAVYCELKGADTAAETLIQLLRDGTRGAVHSFDHRLIAEAMQIAPSIPRGVLEISYPVDHTYALRAVKGRDLWRQRDFIDPELISVAHSQNVRVIAWTVNEPEMISYMAEIGVDGICTDDVALARSVLNIR